MRVSSLDLQKTALYSMMKSQENVRTLTEQISSGKRIMHPADNPSDSSRVNLLKSDINQLETYQNNTKTASNHLSLVETNLANTSNALLRVDELLSQATNGTINASDREALAAELEAIKDDVLSLANMKDSNGRYLFSGNQSETKAYIQQGNNITYQGDLGQRSLQIGSSIEIPISYSGYDVYENVLNGNGNFVTNDGIAANTGTGKISAGSVLDPSAYIAENYSITFVTNSSAELAYQVVGSTSGQLIPPLPATIPDDAPAYETGEVLTFNGIEITISGAPNVGDDFGVEPSYRQNIFTTLQNMIDALRMPQPTGKESAEYANTMDRNAGSLKQAMNNISMVTTKVGANMKTLDNQILINDTLIGYDRETLSSLADIDMVEAVSNLVMQSTTMQAAQLSYMKIQDLSLFNYL